MGRYTYSYGLSTIDELSITYLYPDIYNLKIHLLQTTVEWTTH